MHLIYYLILSTLITLTLPLWLWRYVRTAKYRGTVAQRCGYQLPKFSSAPKIWIHAVSVGEALTARGLVTGLQKMFPNHEIVMSTVTKTGQHIAQKKLPGVATTFYLPVDLPWAIARTLKQVRPRLLIVMETELWPGLFQAAQKQGIPVIVVNGRISPRSFNNYSRVRFFMRHFLQPVCLFAMQSPSDAERIIKIGAPKKRVVVAGNIKYDQALTLPPAEEIATLEHRLPRPKTPVWIAASTHPGEEAIILAVYQRLLDHIQQLRLILVPRHPERTQEVERLTAGHGWKSQRISQIQGHWQEPILLVDEVGWLTRLYGYAQVAFVGGSLVPHGGQNILEPAAWAIPPVFGPHTFNFKDIAYQILEAHAGFCVLDAETLFTAIRDLLTKPEMQKTMGEKARAVVENNAGALERTLKAIQETVDNPPL